MREKTLGRTGLRIMDLGFGGIPIQRLTEAEAVAVVRHCYELGINYYDTARNYTTSEERIGKALVSVRDKVVFATKSGRRTRDEVMEELEISLGNLQTDYIDVYQLHNVSQSESWERIKSPDGALEALRQAKEQGKIRFMGITSHSPALLGQILRECDVFDTVMVPYNYMATDPAMDALPLCRQLNVGTVIMKPFGGGVFHDARTALKFTLGDRYSDVVIPGMMSIGEVDENVAVAAGSYELTPEEWKLIGEDKAELGSEYCRGCDYCQPCPQEIPISFVLRAEQAFLKRMGWSERLDQRFREAIPRVESCIECRDCASRCPYQLDIPALLPLKVASLLSTLESGDY